MRQAYELAHSTAILFHHGPIGFVGSEDIIFKQPVPIGSLLSLQSRVVFVQNEKCYVQVYADIIDPFIRKKSRTNEFFFVFGAPGLDLTIIPQTYDERYIYTTSYIYVSMQLISGRRKAISRNELEK
jgi:acyl-coenzyme A thioesterase 9